MASCRNFAFLVVGYIFTAILYTYYKSRVTTSIIHACVDSTRHMGQTIVIRNMIIGAP